MAAKDKQGKLTGERIAQLRDEGKTWKQVVEAAGLPEGASAIPLRNLMYKAAGKQTKAKSKAAIAKEVLAMRDAGHGWPRISAATGLSVGEARAAYKEAGGTNPDGRVYVRTEGSGDKAKQVTSLRVESTHSGTDGQTQGESAA